MRIGEKVGIWFQQIRGPFLFLALFLVWIGVAAAHWYGYANGWHALLLFVGVTLAHVSVNLFNELADYRSGIDRHTVRTPFSGGSGMMQSGKTSPRSVRIVAYATLLFAGAIGAYFTWRRGWFILLLMLTGGIAIRFYTSHLARFLVGELISGITLGSFVVLGSFYVLSGTLSREIIWLSLPPGLLTSLLLFLNEFPDAEADQAGGRHHLVIHFGKQTCSRIYVVLMALVYALILLGPFLGNVPYSVLLGLLTMPLAVLASIRVWRFHSRLPELVPALALNVGVVLLTDLLLALAFVLA